MSESLEAPASQEEAVRFLTALGAAWTTYRLYPNPRNQPAFQRSVQTLASFEGSGLMFDVAAGWFSYAGEEIGRDREGVERLAKQCFIHDIEAVRLAGPPTADDLCGFFGLLDLDDDQVRSGGGFGAALADKGIRSLQISERGLLREEGGDEGRTAGVGEGDGEGERYESEIANLVEEGASPEDVAQELTARNAGDDEAMAKEFVEAYREIHGVGQVETAASSTEDLNVMLAPYLSPTAPWPAIRTFVETFFHLPRQARVGVMRAFLQSKDDGNDRMFLDQFAGHELADLAPELSADEYSALIDYAQEAAEAHSTAAEELFSLLHSASEVRAGRQALADRITDILDDPSDESGPNVQLEELRGELDPLHDEDVGLDALRMLIGVEERPHRFRRLLRIWTGRIGTAIRAGDFDHAKRVFDAVESDASYPSEQGPAIQEALGKVLTPELIAVFVARFTEEGSGDEAVQLLARFGPSVAERLVEQLAVEESRVLRRGLTELLAAVGGENPASLLGRLDDSRWYVVRNLATALGKTGRPEAAEPLIKLLKHGDHRVRVEALRALVPILDERIAEEMAGRLADPNERVRQTALALLKSASTPGVDAALVGALQADDIPVGDLDRIALTIVERGDAAAVLELRQMGGRSFSLRARQRALGRAAKSALQRMKS